MTHTIDDLWDRLDELCKRLTTLETQYVAHIEEKQRKREKVSYLTATALAALAIAVYLI